MTNTHVRPVSEPDVSVDDLLIDSATAMFGEVCSFDAVQAAEDAGWSAPVWQAVADAGFAWIGVPESFGGSGGTLADACEVLRVAGAHAAPIPIAETGILAGWLLGSAGLALPEGPTTLAPGRPEDELAIEYNDDGSAVVRGTLHRVPWAAAAEAIIVYDPGADRTLAIPGGSYETDNVTNMAGEPRETVTLDGVAVAASAVGSANAAVTSTSPIDRVTPDNLRLRGALSRVMLIAGALEAMLDLTVGYTEERFQFGRPIGRFQAVQQHLVWSAQDAALTKMAAQLAARQAARGDARWEIAAARTLANESVSTATRQCHQAHGAMGMTQEYALHHLSRRLWAWRAEWAWGQEWPEKTARIVESVGGANLYPLITAGSAILE